MKRLRLIAFSLPLCFLSTSVSSLEQLPYQLLKAGYSANGELIVLGVVHQLEAVRSRPVPDFFGDIQLREPPELSINTKRQFRLVIRQFDYSEAYLQKAQGLLPAQEPFTVFYSPELKVRLMLPCLWPPGVCRASNVIIVKSCPSSAWVGYPPGQESQAQQHMQKTLKDCQVKPTDWR